MADMCAIHHTHSEIISRPDSAALPARPGHPGAVTLRSDCLARRGVTAVTLTKLVLTIPCRWRAGQHRCGRAHRFSDAHGKRRVTRCAARTRSDFADQTRITGYD